MKHKTSSSGVLRSCTAAARAADAHAQESANWAEQASLAHTSAVNAAEEANNSANRCRRLTADMQSSFDRVYAAAVAAYIFAAIASVLALIALTA